MALKVIKSGAVSTLKIQQILFSQDTSGMLPSAQTQAWPDLDPVVVPANPRETAPAMTVQPSVDIAQIEKAAFENGYLQGQKAGAETAEKRMEAVMRRYSDSVLELEKLRSYLYSQAEREVVKLAVEVAKKIVHRDIQVDKEIVQTLVRVALNRVSEKTGVTIHLNPVDYNYLLAQRAELSQSEGRDISLLADKSIERGGCLIQTECGDIDARIEEKFREVEQAFFEGMK